MVICQNGKDQAESSKLLTLEITSNKNSDTFVFFSLNETWNVQGFTVKSDSDEDILQLNETTYFDCQFCSIIAIFDWDRVSSALLIVDFNVT